MANIGNNTIALTGAQIKDIRLRHGLSQQQFGLRLGVTHAHISKIENGKETPSETLLRLIGFEFGTPLEGIPSADESKEKIEKYLEMLSSKLLNEDMGEGCLFQSEFILAALITILRETKNSEMYRELLLESIGGIIDEVALFLAESSNKGNDDESTKLLLSSRFQRASSELTACCNSVLKLLKERIK